MFVVWVVFLFWGLCCLLFEEKESSDKENLLLPFPISILDKFVLDCFRLLGLEMLTDKNQKSKLEDKIFFSLIAEDVRFCVSWLKTNQVQCQGCLWLGLKFKSNQYI